MGEIGVHETVRWMGLTFNLDTLQGTWISMAVIIVVAIIATRRLSLVPNRWQSMLEMAIGALGSQVDDVVGPRGKNLKPLYITLFLFILVANWQGLVPGLKSPTNDLNTTLGLALFMVCLVHILGLKYKGLHYIKHFFEPYIPFIVINIIEEFAKPITLSFRLFGNIFAGEVLTIILVFLMPAWMAIPGVAWLAFSVFVGAVQAFIFTMLTMSYAGGAIRDLHGEASKVEIV